MREKIKTYLDSLFTQVLASPEVQDAHAELYDSMLQRFDDCVADGMDEQEAYDTVIDSIGDLRELFDELNAVLPEGYEPGRDGYDPDAQKKNEECKNNGADIGFDIGNFLREVTTSVVDFTGGFVSGLFTENHTKEELTLVNSRTLPLEGIASIDVSYLADSIFISYAPDEELTVNEYMNVSDDESVFANVSMFGNSITVKCGRRQGVMLGLRTRIEILLPKSFGGSFKVSSVSGKISSEEVWDFSSLTAKTVSGKIRFENAKAGVMKISSTSGSIKIEKAEGAMDLSSISGSIKVEEANGGGIFKTTTGSVRVNFTKLTSHVDAASISGGVRLAIPDSANFEFDAKTITGQIHTGFDNVLTYERRNKAYGFVGEAPFMHVRAASTSGSIHVND